VQSLEMVKVNAHDRSPLPPKMRLLCGGAVKKHLFLCLVRDLIAIRRLKMKTTSEKIAVMQAFEDGVEVEIKLSDSKEWRVIDFTPEWDWGECNYRVKQQPTGSDIVRELLKEGRPVWCGVSNTSQADADGKLNLSADIVAIDKFSGGHFKEDYAWKYASAVDTSKFAQYVPEVK